MAGSFVEADGREEEGLSDTIDVEAWQRLVTEGLITLGGVRPAPAPASSTAPAYTSTTVTVSVTY